MTFENAMQFAIFLLLRFVSVRFLTKQIIMYMYMYLTNYYLLFLFIYIGLKKRKEKEQQVSTNTWRHVSRSAGQQGQRVEWSGVEW